MDALKTLLSKRKASENMHKRLFVIVQTLVLLLALFLPHTALATENSQSSSETNDEVYTLFDDGGKVVTRVSGECAVDDEYINEDNQHYRVIEVDEEENTGKVEYLGVVELPDVSWLSMEQSLPVSAAGKSKKIALYCTHSDESYVEGDGESSSETRGGIYDVAKKLSGALKDLGVTVEQSQETHHPHDAGAYRRSRQTAMTLLKNTPDAIFDIHRDGIPDPDEYAVTIGNEKMSKVRLLVGRSNQNKEANLSFAKQIKAVADKVYPKLIKDIYMGKGSYNQDLAPRSVLLEFGTHTLAKERVLRSTGLMAEVIYKAIYGGVTGSAGASDVSGSSGNAQGTSASTDNKGATSGIGWMIAALVVGLLIFALVAGGGTNKFKRSFSEMTGGLVGKKPPKDE